MDSVEIGLLMLLEFVDVEVFLLLGLVKLLTQRLQLLLDLGHVGGRQRGGLVLGLLILLRSWLLRLLLFL